MSAARLASYLYYSRISNPSHERIVYQRIKQQQATRFVEIGMGQTVRSTRMIEVAQRFAEGREVHYTGLDRFEARDAGEPGLALKGAFRVLRPLDIRLRLVPGDPLTALSQCANYLVQTDVVVISADQGMNSMEQAWAYLPRMLHEESIVFFEQQCNGGLEMKILDSAQVQSRAQNSMRHRRLAA